MRGNRKRLSVPSGLDEIRSPERNNLHLSICRYFTTLWQLLEFGPHNTFLERMPRSTRIPSSKVAHHRHQAPRTRRTRLKRATTKKRSPLQLQDERYWVGTLRNSSHSPSSGDPRGNVYLYFVNGDKYSLQDSKRKDVVWDNIQFKEGFNVHNIDELVEKVIGKILRRSHRQSTDGI
ncbi:hypothetical protein AU210_016050 [Fusarium oxysporum f. sp. radicis-cucumerinum]|uniref:Uncharacterized protein n=1 Tax=Fusarium oxysporum f. sp. radicis-cucumerinum TaxID=327505 RepID=A0A2H3FWA7_FUSOX|nr:hypothetical protein AU210_016050 [Fusarium oxysporum f. sp. radicis-cucumerinum]